MTDANAKTDGDVSFDDLEKLMDVAVTKSGVLFVDGPSCVGKSTLLRIMMQHDSPSFVLSKLSVKKMIPHGRDAINTTAEGRTAYLLTSGVLRHAVDTVVSRSPMSNVVYFFIGLLFERRCREPNIDSKTLLDTFASFYSIDLMQEVALDKTRPLIILWKNLDQHLARKKNRGEPKDAKSLDVVYLQAEQDVYIYFASRFGWPSVIMPDEPSDMEAVMQTLKEAFFAVLEKRNDHDDIYALRGQDLYFDATECRNFQEHDQMFPLTFPVFRDMPR